MSARMMQGDCPKGYKQTEVGVIPEDWVPTAIGNIAPIATGSTPPTGDSENYGDEFLFVSPADMGSTKYISVTGKMLSKKGFSVSRQFPAGSILFVCIGSTIGKCGIASETLTSNQQINAIFPVAGNSPDYLYYAISAASTSVKALAGEQAVPIVNKSQFAETKIPLPPTKAEQEAIAEALSDADALIESLEQLIAKKRQVKQGAMQELLTGKRRLPGFSGEWEVKRLGDVLKFQVGFPFGSAYFNEASQGIRLVKNRDLKSDDQVFFYSGNYNQDFLVQDGDVLVGMDGDFLPCLWSKGLALLNQRVGRIVPRLGLHREFAYYYLLEPLKAIENMTSSTTVKHLSHGDIEGIEKALPAVEEQTAIAAILSDMDAEIAELEAKLAKARQVKQGMMQELLTGRIRLV